MRVTPTKTEDSWYEIIVFTETGGIEHFQGLEYRDIAHAERDLYYPTIVHKKRRIVKVTEIRELVCEKDPVKKELSADEIREALKKCVYVVSKEDDTQYVPFNIYSETFSIPITPTNRITYSYEDCYLCDGYVFFKKDMNFHTDKRDGFKLVGSLF